MTAESPVVVPPSIPKLLALLLIGGLGVAGGLRLIAGPGLVSLVGACIVVGLILLALVVAVVGRRPRLEITPEGFTVYRLFGEDSRKWSDVDGQFAVIRLGLTKAVAYHASATYKERTRIKPTTIFGGYDAAISGAFRLNAEQLAELLNKHARKVATGRAS